MSQRECAEFIEEAEGLIKDFQVWRAIEAYASD